MKTAPLAIMLAVVLSALPASALELQPGESIGIDLGATLPTNAFNPWMPNPANPAENTLSSVHDTNGIPHPEITVTFGGTNTQSSAAGTSQDIANTPGFAPGNLVNAVTGYNLSMTISGLTPGQAFTLGLVSSCSTVQILTKFTWGAQSLITDSTSTTGGTLAYFSNITADASGNIFITARDSETPDGSRLVGVNAALLTAQSIPEPSVGILSLLGGAGLAFAQRACKPQG